MWMAKATTCVAGVDTVVRGRGMATRTVPKASCRGLLLSSNRRTQIRLRSQEQSFFKGFKPVRVGRVSSTGGRGQGLRMRSIVAELLPLSPNMVEVGRSLGSVGFVSLKSWPPRGVAGSDGEAQGYDTQAVDLVNQQEFEEGSVTTRLYEGRIVAGPSANAKVILKAYPARALGSQVADAMAYNELMAHSAMQPPAVAEDEVSPFLPKLIGAFVATEGLTKGEQWLVFRNDGTITAAAYATEAAVASEKMESLGEGEVWDFISEARPLDRRRRFVKVVLYRALCGLAFMHARDYLHQSLGAGSVFLDSISERDFKSVRVQLRDMPFAVDVSDKALAELDDARRTTKVQELAGDLWQRAGRGGAESAQDRRAFGKADDVYAAGLLLAVMLFVPFSDPGSIDAPALQRLFEGTFRLDIKAARDFCVADERWTRAVDVLDANSGAGWNLLQAMMNADWKKRPTVEEVQQHPFFTG